MVVKREGGGGLKDYEQDKSEAALRLRRLLMLSVSLPRTCIEWFAEVGFNHR